jgi:hypothetical protein
MAEMLVRQLVPDDLEPELVAIALPIYRQWQAAALRVAANHGQPQRFALPTAKDSPEAILEERFRVLAKARPAVADAAAVVARENLDSPGTQRLLSRAVLLDFSSDHSVTELALAGATPQITKKDLLRLVDRHYAQLGMQRTTSGAPSPVGKVRLELIRMVCIDETNGFLGSEAGDDEIHLFGDTIDESGNTDRFKPFKVGDFSDNDRKDFNPPKRLFTWDVGGGNSYPKHYFAEMFLVEKDQGDLDATAEQIFRRLADAVKAKVAELLIKAGTSIGGPLGAAAGALAGWLAGWLIGKLVDFLIQAWKDDLFEPRQLEFIIPNATSRLVEPSKVFHFRGPGEYAVRYRWSVLPK